MKRIFKRINLSFVFPLTVLVIGTVAFSLSMYQLPPLGRFLNPFIGCVQNHEGQVWGELQDNGISTEGGKARVFFDQRQVPHIFADNDKDLYFAQGYVHASFRLWQMDFVSYLSAGRLSEVFGTRMLSFDRMQRRNGILEAARQSLLVMERDSATNAVLTAYTNGVNSYISQTSYETFPLEYKLLNYAPEPWTKLKTVLIMKHMGNGLTGYNEDEKMSALYVALGPDLFFSLYPDYGEYMSPVNGDSILERSPEKGYKNLDYLSSAFLDASPVLPSLQYNPRLGSNNWAISGRKAKSGQPILCNDIHLNLSFPSVWIEMQLTSDRMNVYGVSIPGLPAVVSGFNQDISWGITNGATDVKDWYKLKLSNDYREYEFDKKMHSLSLRVEEIKILGHDIFVDTVYLSRHGPIVSDNRFQAPGAPIHHALRWELLGASNDLLCFIKLNHAKNYSEFRDALRYFSCPVQNFAFASRSGDIAIFHQGKIAKRWPGQGRFILDGSRTDHLTQSYIPFDSLPHLVNPKNGYVFSANQRPTGNDYPFYYSGFFSEERANRIQYLLDKGSRFEIEDMKNMQRDNITDFASRALPILISALEAQPDIYNSDADMLKGWNGAYDENQKAAHFFELLWKNVESLTWDELQQYSSYSTPPNAYILLDMIEHDSKNEFFDRQGTDNVETAPTILGEAYRTTLQELGAGDSLKAWGDYNKVQIPHMTNIESFGVKDLATGGHPNAINALANNWGPTWRMIVEMGAERPIAYGIYPGGQSGNIGSPHYDDFVKDWVNGIYYELIFFLNVQEAIDYQQKKK